MYGNEYPNIDGADVAWVSGRPKLNAALHSIAKVDTQASADVAKN